MVTGSEVVLQVLRSEGIPYIFGNPGTTELSLIDALAKQDDIKYILGLQEATAVGMAEGYARATNKPAFVNLHATAGLGNGLGALSNAAYTNAPMVVTAGQQDYRHILDDPWLTGDLVGLAKPLCKWAHEVRNPNEIGTILRRAFKDANSFPKGPVFVSLPSDFMDAEVTQETPKKSLVHQRATASDLDALAKELASCSPDQLVIVAGDEIAYSQAMPEVVALAERLGVEVLGSPLHDSVNFPSDHPLWAGMMPPVAAGMKEMLSPYKKILLLGDRPFMTYVYTATSPVPDGAELFHLSADPKIVGRTFTTRWAGIGDIKASLHSLLPRLSSIDAAAVFTRIERKQSEKAKAWKKRAAGIENAFDQQPIPPEVAAWAIADTLPKGTIIIDEGPSITGFIREFWKTQNSLEYNFSKGGGLGWAMPAAVGMALAKPDRRIVCLIGDGAAMYSPQALWTAANQNLPITFVVVNNTEYGILKNYLRDNYPMQNGNEVFVGMDLSKPEVDYVALGQSMGVPSEKINRAKDISQALNQSLANTGGPSLIEITIARSGR